jgi:hypothetical protein
MQAAKKFTKKTKKLKNKESMKNRQKLRSSTHSSKTVGTSLFVLLLDNSAL